MSKTKELEALKNKYWEAIDSISAFVKENQESLIAEFCEQFNLDPVKNEVRIYGHQGCIDAYYTESSEYGKKTKCFANSGDGWHKW